MNDPQEDSRRGRHRRAKTSHDYVRRGVTLAVPVGAVLVGIASAGTASADAVSDSGSPVTGYGQLCLDDRGAAATDYNAVQVATCNGTRAQDWSYVQAGSAIQDFGMCLDVYAAGTWDGDAVDLYQCNDTGAQVWIPQSDGALYNPESNKCLDDTDWGGDGTQLQIWDCTGNANQAWTGDRLETVTSSAPQFRSSDPEFRTSDQG